MTQVFLFSAFALLLARVVRAPKGTWRYILAAAVAALLASQLLPDGNAYKEDVAGSARTLFWIGLGLVPVGAYAIVVSHVRKRTGVDDPAAHAHPQGLVQFADDATLAVDTASALASATDEVLAAESVSFGWRDDTGRLIGHVRVQLVGDLAEIELLRIEPDHWRNGIGSALLRAAMGEAHRRGARRVGAFVGDWQTPEVFVANGFSRGAVLPAGRGQNRTWLDRPL